MKLIGEEMRKFEYILDIFKGTCELNNFDAIKVPAFDEDRMECNDVVLEAWNAVSLTDEKKVYFYGPELKEKEETLILGALLKKTTIYKKIEMINMAVKFLFNLGLEETTVTVSGNEGKSLQESLEMLNIPVEVSAEEGFSFTVKVEDKIVVFGGTCGEEDTFMEIDYRELCELVDYKDKLIPLDVYVAPASKDVLDDALSIGTDLRDAGLKVEIDYSLKQVTKDDVDATFLVIFDSNDIAKYEVKLIDMATEELKTVKIDNLIEEVMFI